MYGKKLKFHKNMVVLKQVTQLFPKMLGTLYVGEAKKAGPLLTLPLDLFCACLFRQFNPPYMLFAILIGALDNWFPGREFSTF